MKKYHNTKDFKKHYLPGLVWHHCHWECSKTMGCGTAKEGIWTPHPSRDSACLPAPPAVRYPGASRLTEILLYVHCFPKCAELKWVHTEWSETQSFHKKYLQWDYFPTALSRNNACTHRTSDTLERHRKCDSRKS